MKIISDYFLNMGLHIVTSIPIVLLVRYIIFLKTNKINTKREIVLILFILFLIGLYSQAIIPKKINEISINNITNNNFIPFKILYDTYIEIFKNNNINYFFISFLGNIIMFIPIGIFLKLLIKLNDKKIILIGFCSSLLIEICQIPLNRCTDIDDLILNTLGVYIGLLICKVYENRF